uniref:Integral membrane protein DGCR2/IDD-like n=1 Tax=Saccoglossus kowalevskii TaxID=10224 RepID=A0ABM0M9T2_SACKO|nr:PREDICTED: integral membrane protein DGCR2/IDD-like [Saccoglossus kowalevskii]
MDTKKPREFVLCVLILVKGFDYCLSSALLPHQGISTLNDATDSNNPGIPVDDIQLPSSIDVRPSNQKGDCPIGWQIYPETGSCYRSFEAKLTYEEAQDQCSTLGGFLATVTTETELAFIKSHHWQSDEKIVNYNWWMGYRYVKNNHTTEWEVADESFLSIINDDGPLIGPSVSDKDDRLCGQLQLRQIWQLDEFFSRMWVQQCRFKSAFLCKRSISDKHCVDNKGRRVDEGQRFTPQGADNCMNCTCTLGEANMCRSAQCAPPPDCIHTIQDPEKCCAYTCMDDEYPKEDLLDFSTSMRWVLTSATSFLILGLLLFMVYRLRQRRLALIHYTSRNEFTHRSGHTCTLDSGSSLTPTSPMDDIDAGIYREPPPPYSLYKPTSPGEEAPPPYDASLLDNPPTTPVSTTDQDAALLSTSPEDPRSHLHQNMYETDSPHAVLDESTDERENVPMLSAEGDNDGERSATTETRA